MLAHAASFQGRKVIDHILGIDNRIKLDIIPAAVFTRPEAGMVGLTEEECKQRGIPFTAKKLCSELMEKPSVWESLTVCANS